MTVFSLAALVWQHCILMEDYRNKAFKIYAILKNPLKKVKKKIKKRDDLC